MKTSPFFLLVFLLILSCNSFSNSNSNSSEKKVQPSSCEDFIGEWESDPQTTDLSCDIKLSYEGASINGSHCLIKGEQGQQIDCSDKNSITATCENGKIVGQLHSEWLNKPIAFEGILQNDALILKFDTKNDIGIFDAQIRLKKKTIEKINSMSDKEKNAKAEITGLMYEFQNLMNEAGFTYIFVIHGEEVDNMFLEEKYYLTAFEEGKVNEDTDLLKYAYEKIIVSNLITDQYRAKVKANYENGLNFSIYDREDYSIGAILTNSEWGYDFTGPIIYQENEAEIFRMRVTASNWLENGFNPNPESIMLSYNITPKEVYQHFIELNSDKTGSYYINSKLIRKYGPSAPRFIMDFVYSEEHGWQINNMYFDDYKGNVVKKVSDFQ